jgi:hypothetical protein
VSDDLLQRLETIEDNMISMKTQRKLAKAGVIATMGVLLWTGMQPRRQYRGLHVWAGMALLGLTVWHWSLYQPQGEKKPRPIPGKGPVPARRPLAEPPRA